VTGVDVSETGIASARRRYRGPRYLCRDAAALDGVLEPASFDAVFVRGMSWYHYELGGKNVHGVDVPAETERLFRFAKPGGLFVLQVCTDFSGRRDRDVHDNRLEDYLGLFEPLGDVVHVSDWKGRAVHAETQRGNSGIIIATRRRAADHHASSVPPRS
jgi:SAM-dependent methyltransferase